jgi:hypothetical protein
MSVTSVPQLLEQSNDININSAQATRVQTFSGITYSGQLTQALNATQAINPTNGGFVQLTNLSTNVTVSFVGIPGSFTDVYGQTMYQPTVWYVDVNNRGTYTITFSGVTWDGGTAPTLASGTGRSMIEFISHDGVTVIGKLLYASLSY